MRLSCERFFSLLAVRRRPAAAPSLCHCPTRPAQRLPACATGPPCCLAPLRIWLWRHACLPAKQAAECLRVRLPLPGLTWSAHFWPLPAGLPGFFAVPGPAARGPARHPRHRRLCGRLPGGRTLCQGLARPLSGSPDAVSSLASRPQGTGCLAGCARVRRSFPALAGAAPGVALITPRAPLSFSLAQRMVLYSFPAICWAYGAGALFSSFVSVVFWTG